MPRIKVPELAALTLALAGLVLLARALNEATPVVWFGTEEEFARRERGQGRLVPAGAALALAAAVLAWRRRFVHAALVFAPGLVCVALAKAYPEALWGGLAFFCLAPSALVAALAASFALRRPAARERS